MKHYRSLPPLSLAEYVHGILVIEDFPVTRPFTLPLFANGFPTLLFQTSKGTIKNKATSHLILFGQTISPDMLSISESFSLIAYFFKPHALVSLFGVGANEMTDKPVDFNLVDMLKISQLQEQLLNAGTVENMLRLIDDFILKLIINSRINNRTIIYATHEIVNNTSVDTLSLVQKDLNITERTFQRLFEKNIGISPNLYRRICQFNNAFEQLNKNQFSLLSDIAYENGYADQSHYIRAFREFTSITPKEYLKFR
jgi:AraC-like DNA-binding protein